MEGVVDDTYSRCLGKQIDSQLPWVERSYRQIDR